MAVEFSSKDLPDIIRVWVRLLLDVAHLVHNIIHNGDAHGFILPVQFVEIMAALDHRVRLRRTVLPTFDYLSGDLLHKILLGFSI